MGDLDARPPVEAWADPDRHRPLPFWESLRRDLRAHLGEELAGASRRTRLRAMASAVVRSSGFHVVASYRLAHTLGLRAGLAGRAIAGVLFWWNRHGYGCSIAWTARLHGGLILPHPQGIVIGAGAVVGPRAWIFQNVTVGGAPGKVGLPVIGADARLFGGAVLAGPITVGDNVMVGANAVVLRDVPARTLVRSTPVELAPLPATFQTEPP